MAKGGIEARLRALAAWRDDPTAAEGAAAIRAALGDRSNAVVAAAARLISEHELSEHRDGVAQAFAKWMAASKDKQALAKTALAEAARVIRADVDDLLEEGLRRVQKEPVWGGTVDAAAELRGICGMALAAEDHPDALHFIADLLADPEPQARIGGARAVAALGRPGGLPLLRLRAQLPDDDARVAEECFAALLALEPEESLPFVGRFLAPPAGREVPAETQEAAALALGDSRVHGAEPVLVAWADSLFDPDRRRVAWTAMAMLRSPAAWDHLVRLIAAGRTDDARAAVTALAPWSHDEALATRVRQAAAEHGDRSVARDAEAEFGS